MRTAIYALALVSVAAATIGCNGEPVDIEETQVHSEVLQKAGLDYYWRLQVPLEDGESIDRLYREGQLLYCLTDRNRVLALDAMRGVLNWSLEVAPPTQTVFRPYHVDGITISDIASGIGDILDRDRPTVQPYDAVLFNTLTYLRVVDRRTGRVVRDAIPFDFAANAGGASDGEYFFVADTTGLYHGIAMQEAVEVWKLSAGDVVGAPLEYYNRRVYVGSQNGRFIAARLATRGEADWRQQVHGPISGGFIVDQRGAFVPAEDNRLYAFDPVTGEQLWEPFVCQGPLRDGVQASESTLFQYARRDRLYAVDLAKGTARWDMPEGRRVLAAIDGDVYVLDGERNLVVVGEMTGERMASLPLTGFDLFARNTGAPAIYLATRDGAVACIRRVEAGHLTPDQMR